MVMSKFLDIFLIAALGYNIFQTLQNYTPNVEILNTEIPTWLAISIQVICIILLCFKLWKTNVAKK